MVLDNKKLISSKKNDNMRLFGHDFLKKVTEDEEEMQVFDRFSMEIVSKIEAIFVPISKSSCSLSSKRAKCWSECHNKRHEDLPKLWKNLLITLGFKDPEQFYFFIQCVNQELFEQMLVNNCCKEMTVKKTLHNLGRKCLV